MKGEPEAKMSQKRTLVLYAYYESDNGKANLGFFNEYGLLQKDSVDYHLIINGTCSVPLSESWDRVLFRENKGYDFGAWYDGLQQTDLTEYTHFIFMNDTLRGPFFIKEWIYRFTDLITDVNKLSGITINCCTYEPYTNYHKRCPVPHVQSMLMCTDQVGLSIIYPKIISDELFDREETVLKKEIGASLEILKAGYNITCILPPYQVDYRIPSNCFINVYNGGCYGNPTFNYFGRFLTAEEAIFLKTTGPPAKIAFAATEKHMRINPAI